MAVNKANFHIFRLTFCSYLEELDGKISDDEKLLAAKQLFECIDENMTFADGKSTLVETDPPDKFGGNIMYTRISRETQETLNDKGREHKARKVEDYPYFNVVFDFRRPTDYILVAIEYKRKAFANIDFVREKLECCFKQCVKDYDLKLRHASLSKRLWRRVEERCASHNTHFDSMVVEIPDVNTSFPLDVNTSERAFFSSFQLMTKEAGADEAYLGFGANGEGKHLKVDRVRETWGWIVDCACKNGYLIKAKLANGMEVTSAADAPAIYPMDKSILGDGSQDDGVEKMPRQEQERKIKEWFDKIYTELKNIEMEEQNDGKSKRHIKK